MKLDWVLQSRRVLLESGLQPASVGIQGERIAGIFEKGDCPPGDCPRMIDVGDAVVFPGLVDSHAHINEPGRTEWEGFATATKAAAAGGITTVVDMPLNSIPVTTTLEALEVKKRAAAGQTFIDYALWGGVVPHNAPELAPMARAGVAGFKAFLVHSGIDDFPQSREADLREAMPILAREGVPLLVHAELDDGAPSVDACRAYRPYLESRPSRWEVRAIELMVRLCRALQCPVHVVHLSAADALPVIAQAKREGLPFTAETCPHYLTLCAEEVPDGRTEFKCAPPIRGRDNREKLWEGLREGVIDLIVSDHSPCTPELKRLDEGNFMSAWGGISSLQFGLPLVWTEAKRRGVSLEALARWMSRGPAQLAGLEKDKGAIAVGKHADFVVWRPEARRRIEVDEIQHRHRVTPYVGREVEGEILATYLRGECIYERGQHIGSPRGQWLSRQSRRTHG